MRRLFTLLTDPRGRIARSHFWLGLVCVVVIEIAVALLLTAMGFAQSRTISGTVAVDGGQAEPFASTRFRLLPWAGTLTWLIAAIPGTIIGIKRRHDRDFPGWDILLFSVLWLLAQLSGHLGLSGFLPFALRAVVTVWGFMLLVYLGGLKGTSGPNRFGPDPRHSGATP